MFCGFNGPRLDLVALGLLERIRPIVIMNLMVNGHKAGMIMGK